MPLALPESADMIHITQHDTLVLQVLDLDCELRLKAQSVAAKSQVQYKAETFLLSPGELARFSSDSVKLQVLQHRMHQLDLAERDLDRAQRQPAGIIQSIDQPQAVQPAERDLDRPIIDLQPAVPSADRPIIDLPPAVQPAERDLDRVRRQLAGIIDQLVPQAVHPEEGQPEAAAPGREPAVEAPATEMKISENLA